MKQSTKENIGIIAGLISMILLYLLPGLFIAELMDGLTHGGLPSQDYWDIVLKWPKWIGILGF